MRWRLACGPIIGLVVCVSCDDGANAPSAGNLGIIALDVTAPVDTADGVRVDTIVATIDTAFRNINTAVAFETSASVFSNGTAAISVIPDSLGVARAFLRAPTDASVAYVTATTGGVSATRVIEFVPAHPSWVSVTASAYVVSAVAGTAVDVTALLVRPRGLVTPGATVRFTATPSQSLLTGRFSLDSAVATAASAATRYVLFTTETGTVVIRAEYSRGTIRMADSVVLRVIPKPPA